MNKSNIKFRLSFLSRDIFTVQDVMVAISSKKTWEICKSFRYGRLNKQLSIQLQSIPGYFKHTLNESTPSSHDRWVKVWSLDLRNAIWPNLYIRTECGSTQTLYDLHLCLEYRKNGKFTHETAGSKKTITVLWCTSIGKHLINFVSQQAFFFTMAKQSGIYNLSGL